MPNLYNNEVIFNGQTLMSLKEDTVTPDKVLAGETFHDRSGAPQTGSLITHNVYDGLDSTSESDALSANQGRVLNSKLTPDWSGSTSWMTTAEQGSCYRSWVGKVVTVTLMTESRVHSENDLIITMPDGWKPSVPYFIPAYYKNGSCVLRLQTDGTLKIWLIGDTTSAGRIYATFTYIRQ